MGIRHGKIYYYMLGTVLWIFCTSRRDFQKKINLLNLQRLLLQITTELLREKLRSSVFLLEITILTKKVQIYGNFSTP